MAAYKDEKRGTWFVQCSYKDAANRKQRKTKRGFATKREAQDWERGILANAKGSLHMSFNSFYALYEKDRKPRLKENTWVTKDYLIRLKILPFFGGMAIDEIDSTDVMRWENELIDYRDPSGLPYSKTYLRTICNQLSAIFNHAVNHYGLHENPVRKAGKMGSAVGGEMHYWTKEEYLRFSDAIMEKPVSFTAFEILYWTGIREGELLALTPSDFDFEKHTLRVDKSYQRIKGEDVITDPKTPKSVRTIVMPKFLCEEVAEYIDQNRYVKEGDRLFQISKSMLYHEMERGSKAAGVKRIRVHDLRHSHVSLLIEMGFNVLAIADRMGHESVDITFRYAHLFPNKQEEMADGLDLERGEAR